MPSLIDEVRLTVAIYILHKNFDRGIVQHEVRMTFPQILAPIHLTKLAALGHQIAFAAVLQHSYP